jgi:hypothetical protein
VKVPDRLVTKEGNSFETSDFGTDRPGNLPVSSGEPILVESSGHDCLVHVSSHQIPPVEAREVHVKGFLHLKCATGGATEVTDVPLQVGRTIDADGLQLSIQSMSDGSSAGLPPRSVVVTFGGPNADDVLQIGFFDQDGHEIPSRLMKRPGSSGPGAALPGGGLTYGLDTNPPTVTLKIVDVRQVSETVIPIEFHAGLGL